MAGSGVKVARVYLRVSTDDQDLTRQENIVAGAKACRSTPPRTFRASQPRQRTGKASKVLLVWRTAPPTLCITECASRCIQ